MMICQQIEPALPRYGHNLRVTRLILIRSLLIGVAMMSMFACGAVAIAQVPGLQPARTPRLEEQWKSKRNANTVSIIAGSPEKTYLNITHDPALLLHDDN